MQIRYTDQIHTQEVKISEYKEQIKSQLATIQELEVSSESHNPLEMLRTAKN